MNYAEIKYNDIANGPGVRVSVFVSGCPHHCKGCFNEMTWDPNYGEQFTEEIEEQILNGMAPGFVSGITLLGGEPMTRENMNGLLPLLRKVKKQYPNKSIWCFTGYVFETYVKNVMLKEWPEAEEFLSYIDVLVDGPYIEELHDWALQFRGSSNQQLIKVKETLEVGEIVLWDGK